MTIIENRWENYSKPKALRQWLFLWHTHQAFCWATVLWSFVSSVFGLQMLKALAHRTFCFCHWSLAWLQLGPCPCSIHNSHRFVSSSQQPCWRAPSDERWICHMFCCSSPCLFLGVIDYVIVCNHLLPLCEGFLYPHPLPRDFQEWFQWMEYISSRSYSSRWKILSGLAMWLALASVMWGDVRLCHVGAEAFKDIA